MLGKLFSGGAADLVKGVGGVIDNLHTSDEERLQAEAKIKELIANYEVEMEKNITSRWEADLKSEYSDAQETRVAVEEAKKFDKFQEALVYLGML